MVWVFSGIFHRDSCSSLSNQGSNLDRRLEARHCGVESQTAKQYLAPRTFYIIYNNWFTLPQGTPSAIWYHPNASWGQCVGTRRSGSMGNRPAHGEQSFWWLQCDTFHLWHDRKRYLVRIVWLRLWGARLRGNPQVQHKILINPEDIHINPAWIVSHLIAPNEVVKLVHGVWYCIALNRCSVALRPSAFYSDYSVHYYIWT